MDILIDTNIILDHLFPRQPHSANAEKILRLCFQQDCNGYIADFSNSPIPVISPEDFLIIIEEQQKKG